MIRAILFDLDGTLLPMQQEAFTKGYFKELAKVLCPLGIAPDVLVDIVWKGTYAMVQNDGTCSNEQRFWQVFANLAQLDETRLEAFHRAADDFYGKGFHNARPFTGETPLAAAAVQSACLGGRKVALATNPLFPMAGQRTRMGWIGLRETDFDLVTSYETDRFCKPNPAYYQSVMERLNVAPQECLMIGNDEREDMYAASQAGICGYLVEDCAIPCKEHPWQGARGSFTDMVEMLRKLEKGME